MAATLACPSCGATHMGRFCDRCGEKRRANHDFSVQHYVGEALEALTHFDSKILRTAWLLVRRPGALSANYLEGRRVRYMTPLRLFLLLSVIYYLSNSIFPYNAFTTPLAVQLGMNDYYPGFAAASVEQTVRHTGLEFRALEKKYNEKTATLSKTLVFSLIPVIALLLWGLLWRKKRFFTEHLIVATHFWSFALILIGVFIPLLLMLLSWLGALVGVAPSTVTADIVPTTIIQLVFAVYLFLMLRRVYRVYTWYAGLLAASIAWSFFHIVWLFRFLLFVVTLHSL